MLPIAKQIRDTANKTDDLDDRITEISQQNDNQQRELQQQISEVSFSAEDRLISMVAKLEQQFENSIDKSREETKEDIMNETRNYIRKEVENMKNEKSEAVNEAERRF